MGEIMRRFALYAALGLLIEVLFTGVRSVIQGNLSATSTSYLWMIPIYGFAALAMEGLQSATGWRWVSLAPAFVLIIFWVEYASGWLLHHLIGACPWDYGAGPWSPGGYINLRYTPFWFALAAGFGPISAWVKAVARA